MAEKDKVAAEVEQARLFKYAAFFSRNKWRIAAGVSLVVAAILIIASVQFLRKRNEAKAFDAYVNAKTAKDFRMVEATFPGTSYGALSLVEAGKSLFKEGKFAQARKLYLQFLKDYPENRLRAWANNLVAATFEAENKYDEAIHYYRKAEASRWLRLQAKLNIGRCYEFKGDSQKEMQLKLNNYELARTYYRQLTETTPSSPGSRPEVTAWQGQARSRMNFLSEKERKIRERDLEKIVDKMNP